MSSNRPLGKFLPNPKLKLREQLAEVCRFRHMSHRTEGAYWHWIKGFIQFHRRKNSGNARPHPGPLHEPFVPPQGLGLRQPSGAFDNPQLPKRQRAGAIQDAAAHQLAVHGFNARTLARRILSPKEGDEWRHPRDLGAAEVQEYLSHLASDKNVAPATQNQALNAIVFLYRDVLGVELGWIGKIERPTRRPKLPTVLTKAEVRAVLALYSNFSTCRYDRAQA